MEKEIEKLGGSAFWIIVILVSLIGLSYLGIWAFHANSVKGVAISTIFFGMIIAGIILSKFEIFNSGTWSENCFSFVLGFTLWSSLLGGSSKSILAVTQNSLFASIASELPQFLEFVINTFVIPIAEESFWMIGIPYSVSAIMNLIGKQYPVFKNIWFQLTVITIVSGTTFALFHVGKMLLGFLIAAFFFRAAMVFTVIGEQKLDLVKGITLVPAFALGAHIGNNWADFGVLKGVQLLIQNIEVGWVVFAILAIIFLSAINQIVLIVRGISNKLGWHW